MSQRPEASLAIQILPKFHDHIQENTIRVVDEIIAYLRSTGCTMHVGPFETTVEGSFDKMMDIQKKCLQLSIEQGAYSVAGYIKLYYTPDEGVLSIDEKITKHHSTL